MSTMLINGCLTVNDGKVEIIDGQQVEILGHKFHNPHCNIVCMYVYENGIKTEITYHKDIETNEEGHEIYKYNKPSDVHYHYTKNYSINNLPKKYKTYAEQLKDIYKKIDFEKYETR